MIGRMDAGRWLQVSGALAELGGLGTVAWGIRQTRAKFTERPSLARRAWKAVSRTLGRFSKRPQTVSVPLVGSITAGGEVRTRLTIGSGPWDEEELAERVERLRRAIENHERELQYLEARIDAEARTRSEDVTLLERRIDEANRELQGLIREAAAGGLRVESVGVVLFAIGVALGTWGNLIA
ncbi:MAG: hypothetical protein KatS3mg014_2165 [Actinomycetota bacterium]|nr:MAG: hypothetical protein KatS3mg014_2165 [Actinomycetota bacterium]